MQGLAAVLSDVVFVPGEFSAARVCTGEFVASGVTVVGVAALGVAALGVATAGDGEAELCGTRFVFLGTQESAATSRAIAVHKRQRPEVVHPFWYWH